MTTTEVVKKKKETLFNLRRLPQVIEMYGGIKRRPYSDSPEYYASHLYYWLRLYAIPGKSDGGVSYPDGTLLSREDANLIKFSVRNIFGRFAFLYPRVSEKKAKKVAQALTRASKTFWEGKTWKGKKGKIMQVVDAQNYKPLHESLLNQLSSSRYDHRDEEEVERLAEYFVIFCQGNKEILKELAMHYHSSDKRRDEYMCYLPSDD